MATFKIKDGSGNWLSIPVLNGLSAYECYLQTVQADTTPMTEAQWLASLKGASAYACYLQTVQADTTPMTEAQWLASLKGASAYQQYCDTLAEGTTPMTETAFYTMLQNLDDIADAFGEDTGALATASGGTGATTAAAARVNLGCASATDLDTLESTVTTLQSTVTTMQSTVTTLQSTVAAKPDDLADVGISYGTDAPTSSTPGTIYIQY